MRINPGFKIILLLCTFWASPFFYMHAQVSLITFFEAGDNAVFNTGYSGYYFSPGYTYKNFNLETAISWSFSAYKETRLDGYSVHGSYSFNVFRIPLTATGFYLRKSLSTELRSGNWGFLMEYETLHFNIVLGNNYRNYRFKNNYLPGDGLQADDLRIVEPWNLVYSITYCLNTKEKEWNVGITLTDTDHHLIEQETNPLVNLKGSYRLKHNIEPFIIIGYKSAGFFNIKVNYFGYYFKTGLSWSFEK